MPPAINCPKALLRHSLIPKPTTPVPPMPIRPFRLYSSSPAATGTKETPYCREKREAQESREIIDRQSDETSKSGTDDAVAHTSISFTRSQSNDPDHVREVASQESTWSNPLDASPANTTMSQGTAEIEGGVKEKEVTYEKGTYRSQSKIKKSEAGFEKRVFAGSSKKTKQTERAPMIRPGAR